MQGGRAVNSIGEEEKPGHVAEVFKIRKAIDRIQQDSIFVRRQVTAGDKTII